MKLGDLFIKLGLQKGEFDKGLDDAKQKTTGFGDMIKKVGGYIAGAFAVGAIIGFGKEIVSIAMQSEGLKKAFNLIGTKEDFENIRKSVRGTVSDIELMKRANMAANFGIPAKELGRLFEFAAKRAQDTGQSVDYLVDSIVIGIGRKSPLILDNLGISIQELRKRMGGMSAETATVAELTKVVGDIAEESFKKSGRFADTFGTKIVSLQVKWENFKLTLSDLFSNSEMLKNDLDDWSKLIEIWQDDTISKWHKFLASISGVQANKIYANKQIYDSYDQMYKDARNQKAGKPTIPPKQTPEVLTAVEQLAELKKVTDELEAQRILRKEMFGEKISPIFGKDFIGYLPQIGNIDSQNMLDSMESTWKQISENREKWTKEELQRWNDFTDELVYTMESGIQDVIGTMASGFGEMLGTGNWDWSNFGSQVLESVGRFMVQLGGLMVAFGISASAFGKAIKAALVNPESAPIAIAAGVALIAAGSAVTAFAQKGLSGGSSFASSASGYSNYSQSSAGQMINGNVVFELQGTTLRGVLNNTDRKNNLIR